MGFRELPSRDQLRDYNDAVAGHAGTLCDADGELFIKPCTQSEIDFYQSANRRHTEFAELMPLFMGSLMLSDASAEGINEAVSGAISETKSAKEHITVTVAEQLTQASIRRSIQDNVTWIPNKGQKIMTDQAVVLENATFGFKRANILDAKLGVRLWADDAPIEKKRRFDKISSETTHLNLGFRIAGMKVFHGSPDSPDLDDEGYKIYDKDYGRTMVNEANVADAFHSFVFNKAAGVDQDLGRAVCSAFARDLARVREILSRHESRIYSGSLLFVFEGDGEALRAAIEENNVVAESVESWQQPSRTTPRFDSGIVLSEICREDDTPEASLPHVYSLKLIDFAHAQWTPGQGPDENLLTGVRSLERIFEEMAC